MWGLLTPQTPRIIWEIKSINSFQQTDNKTHTNTLHKTRPRLIPENTYLMNSLLTEAVTALHSAALGAKTACVISYYFLHTWVKKLAVLFCFLKFSPFTSQPEDFWHKFCPAVTNRGTSPSSVIKTVASRRDSLFGGCVPFMTMLHVPRCRFNVARRSAARTIKASKRPVGGALSWRSHNVSTNSCSAGTLWKTICWVWLQPPFVFCFFGTGALTGRCQHGVDGRMRDLCLRQSFSTIRNHKP